MATARAIANGNWSATSTWNGGVLPGNGDTVYANGFNVTLDVDVNIGGASNPIVNTGSLVSGQWYEIVNVGGQNWTTIGATSNTTGTVFQSTGAGTGGNLGTARALATLTTATNTAAGATTGGGVFTMSTVRAMTADLRAGATTCLNVTATSGSITISGIRGSGGSAGDAHALNNNSTALIELSACTFNGASGVSNAFGLNNAAGGTVNVAGGCTFTGGSGSATFALNNAATGTVNVTGSCTFTGGAGNGTSVALNNAANGNINVSGACIFTGGTGAATANALSNVSTGTVNVTGSCTFTGGTGSSNQALNNGSIGTLIVTNSTFSASSFTNAVNIANSGADVRLSGDFLDHWSGWKAVNGGKWRLGTTPTAARTRYALAGTTDSYVDMFTADNATFGQPATSNVRSGIVYGGGILTGTCAVPSAGSVAFGVPIDNTTGTAILTQANVQAALTAQGLTTARAGNLDNLDASVSSRLAASAYTTPPTASAITAAVWAAADKTGYSLTSAERTAIATAVEQSILNENDGQAILNAIVGAIGNQNIDQVALVAAIRSDLERAGGRLINLDATISSRLAASSYTAPTTPPTAAQNASAVRTELATELARVDVAVSTRLAPSGTLETVTNLTNAPASVTPSDIWSHANRTLTSASGPTAAQNASAVRTELALELAKVSALNTDRLAQAATVEIVGTLIAQANS